MDEVKAIKVAKQMILDGSMPTPEEAIEAWGERQRATAAFVTTAFADFAAGARTVGAAAPSFKGGDRGASLVPFARSASLE